MPAPAPTPAQHLPEITVDTLIDLREDLVDAIDETPSVDDSGDLLQQLHGILRQFVIDHRPSLDQYADDAIADKWHHIRDAIDQAEKGNMDLAALQAELRILVDGIADELADNEGLGDLPELDDALNTTPQPPPPAPPADPAAAAKGNVGVTPTDDRPEARQTSWVHPNGMKLSGPENLNAKERTRIEKIITEADKKLFADHDTYEVNKKGEIVRIDGDPMTDADYDAVDEYKAQHADRYQAAMDEAAEADAKAHKGNGFEINFTPKRALRQEATAGQEQEEEQTLGAGDEAAPSTPITPPMA
jgi:hypothetical protein